MLLYCILAVLMSRADTVWDSQIRRSLMVISVGSSRLFDRYKDGQSTAPPSFLGLFTAYCSSLS